MQKEFYTITEFADKINVHPNTIRRNIKKGKISAIDLGNGIKKIYRIPAMEVKRLMVLNLKDLLNMMENENV